MEYLKFKLFLFSILFLVSSIYMTASYNSIGIFLIYGMLVLIGFTVITSKTKLFITNKKMFLWFFMFTLFNLTSSLINADVASMVGAIGLLFLYVITCVVFPTIVKEEREGFLVRAILISHIPLLLIPIILSGGINRIPYSGIFYNTNSM